MASNSKNIAELLNGDVTLTATDIADDAVTADKLANSINTEIAANTAKVTNYNQTKSDIESLGILASSITGDLPVISGASLTGLTSSQMPAGVSLQTVGLGLRVASPTNSVTVTFTPVIVDGFVKSIIPKKTDSNFVVSTGGYFVTGSGAREIVRLYARKSTTDTGNNFDTTPNANEQLASNDVTVTTQSVSGWTHLGTIGYSNLDATIHNQTNFVRNATLPSYSAGETIQFGIALGSDTSGYTATLTFGGNTATGSPYLFISEIGV